MLNLPKKNKKITPLEILVLFQQLTTLLSAGIPLVQCCQSLAQGQENIALSHLLLSIKKELEAGRNLSHAVKRYPDYFDNMTYQLIYLGEQTGSLDHSLERITQYKKRSLLLTNKLKQTLFYPTIVITLAFIITTIMMLYVVPQFAALFQGFHTPIPALTAALFAFSSFLRHDSWIVILIFITLILISWHNIKKISLIDFLLHLPIISAMTKKIILIYFVHNLNLLLSAGLPIAETLKLLSINSHSPLTPVIKRLHLEVTAGKQLHQAMQAQHYFPAMMLQLIKTGEESGTLVLMLTKITYFYESEVDHFLAKLEQLLEPLIMVVLGALIGGLVIALYLPIFNLGTTI